jgi:hypothetical protein
MDGVFLLLTPPSVVFAFEPHEHLHRCAFVVNACLHIASSLHSAQILELPDPFPSSPDDR